MQHPDDLRLTGPRGITLRRLRPDDESAIAALLARPEVALWWGPMSDDELRDDVMVPPTGTMSLVIELDGRLAGLLQVTEEDGPSFRWAAIDISIDPDVHGRGLGPDAIRTACGYLFNECGHHRITIDPRADNERAIAAYRKVGFKPVGVMRDYERTDDGALHDGLLMDLLRDELT